MAGHHPLPEGARHAPHTLRNREPILSVLAPLLGRARAVLEIGCGTGEQAAFFARALPHLEWLPSDPDPEARASAAAWGEAAGLANLRTPIALDAAAADWTLPEGFVPDAIVAINVIHIAPWAAAEGIAAGAGRRLPPGGVLYLYGPFRVGGRHTAPSNAAFDESLRTCDPSWGLRNLEAVVDLAASHGLAHADTVEMPANNLSVVFRRPGDGA